MTILARAYKIPRLNNKDGYCALSYFDGYNYYYPSSANTGNYLNTGSLGDLADLRLNTTSSYIRIPIESKFGHQTPIMNTSLYGNGLSTNSTSYGLNNSITLEGWFFITSISAFAHLLTRSYNTSWSGAYASYCVRVNSSNQVSEFHAISGSSYEQNSATSAVVILNTWNHFGMTFENGGNLIVYFNGVPVITLSSKTMYSDNSGMWCFGGGGKLSGPEGLNGIMAGIRLHTTIRSADWMLNTYKIGNGVL